MNEIKFRAWDKKKNEFFKPTYKAHEGNLEYLQLTMDGRVNRVVLDEWGDLEVEDESLFENRYEITQYTGLKDVNGKEIYEGDIVKQIPKEGYEHIIAKGDLGIIKSSFGSCTIINAKDGRTHFFFYTEQEVLGNIHQHPELLSDSQ